MNGNDIFKGLKYVGDDLVEEAEFGRFPRRTAKTTFKRPLLAAALIAISLLLAGCAVVYVMHMRDLKLGEIKTTEPVFDPGGRRITGIEDVTYHAISFAGLKGSPSYQAAQEWFAFTESYEAYAPEEPKTHPQFPEEYSWYQVDSQEMKDALDGILKKYGLKLMGVPLKFGSTRAMCSALGIETMLTEEKEASVRYGNGICWESGNFRLDFDIPLPENPESEAANAWGVLHWNRKEVLDPEIFLVTNLDNWKQWNYTTASGNQVLMMRTDSDSDSGPAAWILCDRPEGVLSVMIGNRTDITDRQMEQVADALDFSIQPRKVSREDVQSQPEAPQEATQDGYTLRLKSVERSATEVTVTIAVTAPEGEDISHKTRKGGPFRIAPETVNLTPSSYSMSIGAQEDGDGLDNTHDIVIGFEIAEGISDNVWNLKLENLSNANFWIPDAVEKVLAVGTWQFEINLAPTE